MNRLNFDENGIIFWDKDGVYTIPDTVESRGVIYK